MITTLALIVTSTLTIVLGLGTFFPDDVPSYIPRRRKIYDRNITSVPYIHTEVVDSKTVTDSGNIDQENIAPDTNPVINSESVSKAIDTKNELG
jgi:hypothetical protein